MSEREELTRAVREAVGWQPVAWFGPRGEDARPLEEIVGPVERYSILADAPAPNVHCLEHDWGERVDLDAYSIDRDPGEPVIAMGERVRAVLDADGLVVAYRSSDFLDAARAATTRGQVLAHHNSLAQRLEHKPAVEQVVGALGIPLIDWHALDRRDPGSWPALDGPVVVRPDSGSGGWGIHVVDGFGPDHADALVGDQGVSVSRFLGDAVPLNVSGVVWNHGVSAHPVSVQLIGVPELTPYDLGYCGNDFSAAAGLDPAIHDQVEAIIQTFGAWLHTQGYRGAFGLDLLADGDTVRFVECNPRMQASTPLSSALSSGIDQPSLTLDHLAACLGVPGPGVRNRLAELAPQLAGAHMVVHNVGETHLGWRGDVSDGLTRRGLATDVQLTTPLPVAPGGALARIITPGTVLNPDRLAVMPGLRAAVAGAVATCTLGRDPARPSAGR